MKFLPEEKKKRFWSIGLLAVCVIGIIYFNFVAGPPGKLGPEALPPPVPSSQVSRTDTSSEPTPSQAIVPVQRSSLLPYGPMLNSAVLKQEKFKSLKPAPELEIKDEDLGKDNLFK